MPLAEGLFAGAVSVTPQGGCSKSDIRMSSTFLHASFEHLRDSAAGQGSGAGKKMLPECKCCINFDVQFCLHGGMLTREKLN